MKTTDHTALMPTEEWIAYMLDVWHPGWKDAAATDDFLFVDGPDDERGPWMIQTTGRDGELIIDGELGYSSCWKR